MDLLNRKEKKVKTNIDLDITIRFLIVIFIIYILLRASIKVSNEAIDFFIPIVLGMAICGIAIARLIYYIIVLIYAFKLENKTSAILLTVGLFLGIVGLVGLFILLNEINQLKLKNSNQEFSRPE